jgi:hypothetical protein
MVSFLIYYNYQKLNFLQESLSSHIGKTLASGGSVVDVVVVVVVVVVVDVVIPVDSGDTGSGL